MEEINRKICLFIYLFIQSSKQLQHWLIPLFFCTNSSLSPSVSDSLTLLPPDSLVSVCLWLCTRKSCYCLPLRAAYICLLSVETKETDHKAYYGARSGVHAVCVCAYGGWTHTHTYTHKPSATLLLPLLM